MYKLLNNTTSTSPGTPVPLEYSGTYKISASIPSGDAASIALEERLDGTGDWMPVADRAGTATLLTRAASQVLYVGHANQQIRATRTGGTAAVTVLAALIAD